MEIENTLNIKIKGNDVDLLKSYIKKANQELTSIGLKNNTITTEEAELIKKLNTELNK